MKQIINARDPVKTELWSRADAVAFYEAKGEPFKVELVQAIPKTSRSACIGTAPGRTSAADRICSIRARCPPIASS